MNWNVGKNSGTTHAQDRERLVNCARSHGVMVSTLDFESSDPSSSLGGTSFFSVFVVKFEFYLT